MVNLINLVISGGILWVASQLFPEAVQIDGTRALIIAMLLIWLISTIIRAVSILVSTIGIAIESSLLTLIGVAAIFLANIFALTIISSHLDGFSIAGTLPRILLAVYFSLFRLEKQKHVRDNRNSLNRASFSMSKLDAIAFLAILCYNIRIQTKTKFTLLFKGA